MAKGKGPRDNCGGEHYSTDCLHPHDKSKINKAKEYHAACRGGGGHNDGHQGDHKNWRNDKKYRGRKYYGNGVQKRVNSWMCYFYCKEWGWNATYTSVFHAA